MFLTDVRFRVDSTVDVPSSLARNIITKFYNLKLDSTDTKRGCLLYWVAITRIDCIRDLCLQSTDERWGGVKGLSYSSDVFLNEMSQFMLMINNNNKYERQQ